MPPWLMMVLVGTVIAAALGVAVAALVSRGRRADAGGDSSGAGRPPAAGPPSGAAPATDSAVEEVRALLVALSDMLARAQEAGSRSAEVFERVRRALDGGTDRDSLERIKSVLLEEVGRLAADNAAFRRDIGQAHSMIEVHRQTLTAWRHAARLDLVTQLPNAAALEERLGEAVARFARYTESFAFVLLRVDDWPTLLARHGEEGTDRLLRGVAAKLRGSLRNTDFLARAGEARFAAILPHIKDADVEQQAARLRRQVEATRLNLDGQIVTLGLSPAWATPQPGDAPAAFLARAEARLPAPVPFP